MTSDTHPDRDPLWFKDAVIYELHVKTFFDSDGDGVGDFKGLITKLDYLADLGVTAIWILPFYPSPLRDDGYDIADYLSVNPTYGRLRDFKTFLKAAHERGLRVITELVINHTSDQHPWFQRARKAPRDSRYRDYYVWSDDPHRYEGTRIIFQDFEKSNWTWDPVAEQYYWHRFYSHQPDLNFENPEVQKAVFHALDFWMDMGIDGMRLDAVPYLYEREGTNCENLPETHAFLKKLRTHIDERYDDRMLLAEANQWPEDAAAYFGDGDECHMNFHFPLMPRMFMALQLENNFPILDILEQTPAIPENCQWAVFLRNHDELTLEMVTDEDRDYMYRVYAADPRARINVGIRRRLAPLVQTRPKIELLNGLLLSLPGTPVLYYGDEIGMGDNIYLGDRDGVRTPMQWSEDRNAGFSKANPQKLYLPAIIDPAYHYESINVEAQQNDPASLLWWMKRILALRNQYKVFGRGDFTFLDPENHKVLAFLRRHEDTTVLVVANLSRFAQFTELDLKEHAGMVPVELFGHTEFPPIGELPYLLSLGPHSFYWFELRRPEEDGELDVVKTLSVDKSWDKLLTSRSKRSLERLLPAYLQERRWFRGKARKLKTTIVVDAIPLPTADGRVQIALVQCEYATGPAETYVLPLAFATGDRAREIEDVYTRDLVARVRVRRATDVHGVLYDPMSTPAFGAALLDAFGRRRVLGGTHGHLRSEATRELRRLRKTEGIDLSPWISGAEQSNTSVIYGDSLILKLFRLLDEGTNPDLEVTRFLTDVAKADHVPAAVGALSYSGPSLVTATLGILSRFVPNQGDAWSVTLDALGRYFDHAIGKHAETPSVPLSGDALLDRAELAVPELASDAIGTYLWQARLLGKRTADLHRALTAGDVAAFEPEPFSELYQRSLYQSARSRMNQTFKLLGRKRQLDRLPERLRGVAHSVLDRRDDLDARLRTIVGEKLGAIRMRCHGDFHLGQVLYTGKDFVVIDFEGEPARSIGERRLKRSPLVDVAGMLRSFHYATVAALHHGTARHEDIPMLTPWAELWHEWVAAQYLAAYLEAAAGARFLPETTEDLRLLLDFHLLDKCIYELGYELNNRPDWLGIPLRGLEALLENA